MLILLALVLISAALRYPLVEHERLQTDSYTIHYLAKAIEEDAYAKWTFHPLSYIGYYPLSYPSGTPFILAELASLTGLSLQVSILLFDIVLSTLFCLAVFCLARQFIRRPEFFLLATLLAVTGPRFVDTTYWDGSARGPLIVLMTLTVFASLRAASTGQSRLLIVAVVTGLGCFALHHMAAMFLLLGAAYVLATIAADYVAPRAGLLARRIVAVYFLAIGSAITVISFGFFEYSQFLAKSMEQAMLFNVEPKGLSIFLIAGVSYTNQIGFILIVAIMGIPSILRNHKLTVATLFPIAVILSFIPLLGNTLYVSMVVSPFVSILGTLWLSGLFRNTSRRILAVFLVVVLCAASIALPLWSTARWNTTAQMTGDTVEVGDQIFNDANYLNKFYNDVPAISNAYVLPQQLAAMSDVKFLRGGIPLALSGYVSADDMKDNVTFMHDTFPRDLLTWYKYENEPAVDMYVLGLMVHGTSILSSYGDFSLKTRQLFSANRNLVVVVDNNWPEEYVHVYGILYANFPAELRYANWHSGSESPLNFLPSYQSYQSERITLFMVEMPVG